MGCPKCQNACKCPNTASPTILAKVIGGVESTIFFGQPPVINPLLSIPLFTGFPNFVTVPFDTVEYAVQVLWDPVNFQFEILKDGVYHLDYEIYGVLLDSEGEFLFGSSATGIGLITYNAPGDTVLQSTAASGYINLTTPILPVQNQFFIGSMFQGSVDLKLTKGMLVRLAFSAIADPDQLQTTFDILGKVMFNTAPPFDVNVSRLTYLNIHKVN